MSPAMMSNELEKMIDIPSPLAIDDIRGELIREGLWDELKGGDAVEGQSLPRGYWVVDHGGGKVIKVPKVLHTPTGSKDSYWKSMEGWRLWEGKID